MKKSFGIVLLAVIALSGCAAASDAGTSQVARSAPDSTEVTAEPIPSESEADAGLDNHFLEGIKPVWQGEIVSDNELLAAAELTCEQLEAGVPFASVIVVEGSTDDAVRNNSLLVGQAASDYCPDYF